MTRDEFADLALSYIEEVTAYTRRLSRTEWDADDLVQGAFEHAFRKWKDLRDPARCRAWLFRIARNLHIDRMRAISTRPGAPSGAAGRLAGPGARGGGGDRRAPRRA